MPAVSARPHELVGARLEAILGVEPRLQGIRTAKLPDPKPHWGQRASKHATPKILHSFQALKTPTVLASSWGAWALILTTALRPYQQHHFLTSVAPQAAVAIDGEGQLHDEASQSAFWGP